MIIVGMIATIFANFLVGLVMIAIGLMLMWMSNQGSSKQKTGKLQGWTGMVKKKPSVMNKTEGYGGFVVIVLLGGVLIGAYLLIDGNSDEQPVAVATKLEKIPTIHKPAIIREDVLVGTSDTYDYVNNREKLANLSKHAKSKKLHMCGEIKEAIFHKHMKEYTAFCSRGVYLCHWDYSEDTWSPDVMCKPTSWMRTDETQSLSLDLTKAQIQWLREGKE